MLLVNQEPVCNYRFSVSVSCLSCQDRASRHVLARGLTASLMTIPILSLNVEDVAIEILSASPACHRLQAQL